MNALAALALLMAAALVLVAAIAGLVAMIFERFNSSLDPERLFR